MKKLYFTYPNRKSIRAERIEYGQIGGKYVLKTFEGEENPKGLFIHKFIFPIEEVFEDEQELLNNVYGAKFVLLEGRWIVQNKQSISQPSFFSTNVIDGEVSVEFA